MLRVITPATNKRLTTADAVRAQFSVPAGVVDATIETWIDRASAQIVSFCGREFAAAVVKQTEVYPTGKWIHFDRFPVSSLAVTVDGTALTVNTDYHVDEEVWRLLRLSDGRECCWGGLTTVLDYTAGYVLPGDEGTRTLPHDVEYAAILLCGSIYSQTMRGDPLLKAQEIDGVGRLEYYVAGQSTELSNPTAERLLRRFVVPGFA